MYQLSGSLNSSSQKNDGIYQTNVSTFFDSSSGSWVPYVNIDSEYLAAIYDSSFNVISSIKITGFTNSSITIETTATAGYLLQGSMSIV